MSIYFLTALTSAVFALNCVLLWHINLLIYPYHGGIKAVPILALGLFLSLVNFKPSEEEERDSFTLTPVIIITAELCPFSAGLVNRIYVDLFLVIKPSLGGENSS